MVWDHIEATPVHVLYMILGGFLSVFSLVSLFIKEKLYIGEATVATLMGVIVGPHCLNWFDPISWGNSDYVTLEVSRIVLIVQVFAVGVELPKKYMLRHWKSVFLLLVPVMSMGWIVSGVIMWGLLPDMDFREGLLLGACITATDPVLASSVVGKGKFAKRVPGHLRNLLSAESGCNDGMAFPFIYLSLSLILYLNDPSELFLNWVVIVILYECIFGCILGAVIGKLGRVMIKFCEGHNLVDRESFLVFYFVLALFSCGVGVTLGTDDLLVAFSAGAAFSWDGWFSHKTEESHVSNVIDLLLNLSYFVYFGAIIPWDSYNNSFWGLTPWRLVVISILVILFRRIPAVLICKPIIPDIRTWREAFFCGHFGPIGVGALFVAILARSELEWNEPVPLAELPAPGVDNYLITAVIWPVTTFMVICSIIVHGSSIAVFTLGKHINTMTFTMSYTRDLPDSQNWLSRLPRLEIGQSLPIRNDSDVVKPPPAAARKLKLRLRRGSNAPAFEDEEKQERGSSASEGNIDERTNDGTQTWLEGEDMITENNEGEIIRETKSPEQVGTTPAQTKPEPTKAEKTSRRKGNVFAYQINDQVVWENEDGEVIKRYTIPKAERHHMPTHERMKVWFRGKSPSEIAEGSNRDLEASRADLESHLNPRDGDGNPVGDAPKVTIVDPSERVVPSTIKGKNNQKDDREEETAPERRRREAALGLRENEPDSDEEDKPQKGTAHSSSTDSASSSSAKHGPASQDDQDQWRTDNVRPTSISFANAPSLERGDRENRDTARYRRHSPKPSLTWSEEVRKE